MWQVRRHKLKWALTSPTGVSRRRDKKGPSLIVFNPGPGDPYNKVTWCKPSVCSWLYLTWQTSGKHSRSTAKFTPLLDLPAYRLTWKWSAPTIRHTSTNDSDSKGSIHQSGHSRGKLCCFTFEEQPKCFAACGAQASARVWFVARSVFLTDHCNTAAHIARCITASSHRDMLDALFCYLRRNKRLIASLSVRCLRSTVAWPHGISNGLKVNICRP